jgi:ABC-type molybdate transport system substrate-binding protein
MAIPIAGAAVATAYYIAQVKSSRDAALDQAWIAYVLGPQGQAVLRAAGFMPPKG